MDKRSSNRLRRLAWLQLNSSKEFHKSLSILGKNSTCNTTTGRRRPAIGTRKSFKEFCSAYSKRVKSIRINKPGITRFVRSNFLLTRNVDLMASSEQSGDKSNFARKKIIISN